MFEEGTCPRCGERIQVPSDRRRILCMFCGQEILVEEALGRRKNVQRQIPDDEYQEYVQRSGEGLTALIRHCKNPMENFRRNEFPEEFEAYYASNRELFEAMDMTYAGAGDPGQAVREMAETVIAAAQEELSAVRLKTVRSRQQLDYNFYISIYLIPAVRKYPGDFSEPFADCLVERWNEAFGVAIGKASYDEIVAGFKRKLCYITTAVCESLGMDPDCRELTLLKEYRDGFMSRSSESRALVEEYYDIAPTIVKRMNREPDRAERCRALYQEEILPCIREIEAGEYEACERRYRRMVLRLKSQYMTADGRCAV